MKTKEQNPYLNLNYQQVISLWQNLGGGDTKLFLQLKEALRVVRRREGLLLVANCIGDNRHERRKKYKEMKDEEHIQKQEEECLVKMNALAENVVPNKVSTE
jgi:hypothetical protein